MYFRTSLGTVLHQLNFRVYLLNNKTTRMECLKQNTCVEKCSREPLKYTERILDNEERKEKFIIVVDDLTFTLRLMRR